MRKLQVINVGSFHLSRNLGAIALLAFGLSTTPAYAQQSNTDVARRHFEQAIRYYQQDDYERALASFRAAYQASPHPSVLYNMAQCQIRLGKRQEAIRLLEQLLTEQPNTPMRDEAGRMIERLRRQPQPP